MACICTATVIAGPLAETQEAVGADLFIIDLPPAVLAMDMPDVTTATAGHSLVLHHHDAALVRAEAFRPTGVPPPC
jgi:hypothetical protein